MPELLPDISAPRLVPPLRLTSSGDGFNAARGMSALLADVRPEDPATIAAAAVLCFAAAIIGWVRPAIRAAQVDPINALRGE